MKERVRMPEQDPLARAGNFKEVNLGYTLEMAQQEADRCLQCKNPFCEAGCPVRVQIKDFIGKVKQGDIAAAYESITETNNLPAICGRVCPQENQCEMECVLSRKGTPVAIGNLERFVADWAREKGITDAEPCKVCAGRKVAIVGAGPAGLTCAADLAKLGYRVTIFEAIHRPGGVLVYGIPEFRLPKKLVQAEVEGLKRLGVEIVTNAVIGRSITVEELLGEEGFEAVFIGSGAGLPKFLGIKGEQLAGVYSANEYLTRVNLLGAWQEDSQTPIKRAEHVVVVGGGNVAMDAARSALRLGAKVSIVYRRTVAEMPARRDEVHHAIEEGIEMKELYNPLEIVGDDQGWVNGMLCQRMELGEPDESGRRRPVPIEGATESIPCDQIIIALGTQPNPLLRDTTEGLATQKWGGLIVEEETGATSLAGVYAGGDAVTGAATVILAMGAGKNAAAAMHAYLGGK